MAGERFFEHYVAISQWLLLDERVFWVHVASLHPSCSLHVSISSSFAYFLIYYHFALN